MSNVHFDKTLEDWVGTEGTDGRADTSSRTATRKFYISRDKSNLYSWKCHYSATANDYVFYIKNTSSTEKLYIEQIFAFADAKCDFDIKFVTGTAVGSTITGVNWNANNAKAIPATALNSGVTGLTDAGDIIDVDVPANTRQFYDFDGSLILGEDDAIAVQVDATADIHLNIIGAFE